MPRSYAFNAAIKAGGFVVWMNDMPDETAESAHLLIPTHHPLESWRDSAPRAGIYGLGQPVMQPVLPEPSACTTFLIASAHLRHFQRSQSIT